VIGALRGRVVELEPTRAVLECSGIGFELRVPLSTSSRLGGPGSEALLLTVMRVTRSGVDLFGFLDKAERDVFGLLTSVKGIGPKAGLNLLSRFAPVEILEIIGSGRIEVMRTVPGIGPKRADSIMKKLQGEVGPTAAASPVRADAEAALMSLGLTRREAQERLAAVKVAADTALPELLKLALKA
jgi:Holliday junction DNA helicase RuvA